MSAEPLSNSQDREITLRMDPSEIGSSFRPLINRDASTDAELDSTQRSAAPVRLPADESELFVSRRYRLMHRLGQGGFGVVYQAYDDLLDREVAIKFPRPDAILTKPVVQRFLREARNVARLDHPNIVPLLGSDESSSLPTIVYHLCKGPTLAAWLKNRDANVPACVAARLGLCLAEAVHHAHTRGILHRDLKPSNILLEPAGESEPEHGFRSDQECWIPRITDFGISKMLERETGQTATGGVLGTPEYMSPEQLLGNTGDIGTHSDVYSLGVILYELLTGAKPYTDGAQIQSIAERRVLPRRIRTMRSDVSRDLEAVVFKCLSYRVSERYSTAHQLADELQRVLSYRPVHAAPQTPLRRTVSWVRRQPALALLTAACIAFLMFGVSATVAYVQVTRRSIDIVSMLNDQLARALDKSRENETLAFESAQKYQEILYTTDLRAAEKSLRDGDVANYTALLERHAAYDRPEEDIRDTAWNYLYRRAHHDGRTIFAQSAALYSLKFSEDGRLAVCCGADGKVHLIAQSDRRVIRSWDAGQGELNCAEFSPDSTRIATSGDDGSIAVWNIQDGSNISRFKTHEQIAICIQFLDADRVITCGNEPVIRLWDIRSNSMLHEFRGHTGSVRALSLSLDKSRLYSCGDDGRLFEWDMNSLESSQARSAMDARIIGVRALATEDETVSADILGRVRIASPHHEPIVQTITASGHPECIAVSSDGKHIAIGSRDGFICIVDRDASGQPIHPPVPNCWRAHTGHVFDLAFSPDGKQLHSVGGDGKWQEWSLSPQFNTVSIDLTTVLNMPSPKHLPMARLQDSQAMFGVDNRVYCWKPWESKFDLIDLREAEVSALAASLDLTLVGDIGGTLHAMRGRLGEMSTAWSRTFRSENDSGKVKIRSIAVSDNADRIAVALQSAEIRILLLDADGNHLKELYRGPSVDIGAGLQFSSDGRQLACGILNDVAVWDTQSGRMRQLSGHSSTVMGVDFHPTGRHIVSASDDRSLRIWDSGTGQCVTTLRNNKGPLISASFTRDGRTIISGSTDGSTSLWHFSTRADGAAYLFDISPENRSATHMRSVPGHQSSWVFYSQGTSRLSAEYLPPIEPHAVYFAAPGLKHERSDR
ncbi:MAG: protein kinase [Pirellulales bacterium]